MPRRKKVQPWDAEGVSKSTYYRNKRKAAPSMKRAAAMLSLGKPPAPSLSRGDLKRIRIADEAARYVETTEAARVGDAIMGVDLDQRIGEAVDKALVSHALLHIEHAIDEVGTGGCAMFGTVSGWAALARALRRAGY